MGLLRLSQREIEEKIKEVKDNPQLYFLLNKRYRKCPSIIKAALRADPEIYSSMSKEEKLYVDRNVVLEVLQHSSYLGARALRLFDEFDSDFKVCLMAVQISPQNVVHINRDPKVFKPIILSIIDYVRLDIPNKECSFDYLRKDKHQYIYYIPAELIDEEIRRAIENAISRNQELDKMLFDIGYGNGCTY